MARTRHVWVVCWCLLLLAPCVHPHYYGLGAPTMMAFNPPGSGFASRSTFGSGLGSRNFLGIGFGSRGNMDTGFGSPGRIFDFGVGSRNSFDYGFGSRNMFDTGYGSRRGMELLPSFGGGMRNGFGYNTFGSSNHFGSRNILDSGYRTNSHYDFSNRYGSRDLRGRGYHSRGTIGSGLRSTGMLGWNSDWGPYHTYDQHDHDHHGMYSMMGSFLNSGRHLYDQSLYGGHNYHKPGRGRGHLGYMGFPSSSGFPILDVASRYLSSTLGSHEPQFNVMPIYKQMHWHPRYAGHTNILPHYHDRHHVHRHKNQYNYYIINGKEVDLDDILPNRPCKPGPPTPEPSTPSPTTPTPTTTTTSTTVTTTTTQQTTTSSGNTGPTLTTGNVETTPQETNGTVSPSTITTTPPTAQPTPTETPSSTPPAASSSSAQPAGTTSEPVTCAVQTDGTVCETGRTGQGNVRPRTVRVAFTTAVNISSVDPASLLCQMERTLCEDLGDMYNGITSLSLEPPPPVVSVGLLMRIQDSTPVAAVLGAITGSTLYGEYEVLSARLYSTPAATTTSAAPTTTETPNGTTAPANSSVGAVVGTPTPGPENGVMSSGFWVGLGVGAGVIALLAGVVVAVVVRRLTRRKQSRDLANSVSDRSSGSFREGSFMTFSSLNPSNTELSSFPGERMMWREGAAGSMRGMPAGGVVNPGAAAVLEVQIEDMHAVEVVGSV